MYNLNEMIKPQAEGKVNSHLYSRTQKKKVQHSSTIKKTTTKQLLVYLVIFACMFELDHQRSAANTLVNKMRLDIFVSFNIIIAGLRHILSLHFTVLIHFDECWICFLRVDELMHIHI